MTPVASTIVVFNLSPRCSHCRLSEPKDEVLKPCSGCFGGGRILLKKVGRGRGGGSGGGFVSKTRSRPPSPSALLPGGLKLTAPIFARGEPAIGVNPPLLGSNQSVTTGR